ncbi:hypothetical protein JHK82_047547 [Glycine max]|nr:hypothetical protein JHK86_047439 [Glycine max]KAG4943382.1 hypothetical protein JHK85_048028 [Glycine max]KAG5097693.1 hypothetical protein JHK82_047547 [Glycine max]KAG5102491.1 hypothetical protein JHK84_047460 [Glycine max]
MDKLPIGVEIAGALKNVLAIAAGIVEGMNLGNNSMAALVSQGCSEICWDSIVDQLVRAISTMSSDNQRQLLENTVVCGDTSSMVGFEERFQKESSLSSSASR